MSQSRLVNKSFGSLSLGVVQDDVTTSKGTVTQDTSLVTSVTCNSEAGVITTVSATTAAGASETFTVNCNEVTTGSVVVVCVAGYAGSTGVPNLRMGNLASGSFTITVTNVHATAALNGVLKVSFLTV